MTKQTQYLVSGSTYIPVGDLRDVTDILPNGVYEIKNMPMRGTVLELRENVDTSVPGKIYGRIPEMVKKTFRAFLRRDRSTGVLLSGERGMGKSMFARLVMKGAIQNGLPVILLGKGCKVTEAVEAINQITQPIVVIMDEFEKNFPVSAGGDDDDDESIIKGDQLQFLSMLDGIGASEKRLFVATVNDTDDLSQFLLNRPGRFYYHFMFHTLTHDEMREYLEGECDRSKVSKKTIDYAVSCMGTYAINYDGIAAIVEELNSGMDINEALADLNLDRNGDRGYNMSVRINGVEYCTEYYDRLNAIRESQKICQLFEGNPGKDFVRGTVIGKDDKVGYNVWIKFDGRKIKLNKDGLAVVPRTAIHEIELCDCELKVKGRNKSADKISQEQLTNISDIKLLPMKSQMRPLYLDV